MVDETIKILERQREDLVVRMLKKHEEVEASRSFTERVLSGIAELLLVVDQNFTVIQASREFYAKTGYPEVARFPLSLDQIFDQQTAAKIREGFAASEFAEFEAQLQGKMARLPIKVRGSTHVTPNGLTLHMLICSDCSEFYELMDRLREGQKQLIHSSRLASLGEMTAGIGHELTQPLNAILLFARNGIKALEKPEPDLDLLRKNLEVIVDRVNKASSIINTMRSFGRKAEEELYPVAINPLVEKILQFLEPQLRIGEVQVATEMAPEGCTVCAVEVRLEQVLLNLIQNGIQAMGKVAAPQLVIGTRVVKKVNPETMRREPYVEISIKDNGHGMDDEERKKIFDPFYTTREAGTGMGLGLSIVERIVRGFCGYIEVDSTVGGGSCFRVAIPQTRNLSGSQKTEAA
ncbi:sensor histidine kinase [Desulforhopalus singaporensis]|uniref:histidine kinase n=1 Tax=Desulforhopalus singaporensis TaxID=91360 RepID=A0A1H0KGL0_9BACT|nr:ATP-binding protein [Desulforhopalus singaporensis]SDO55057.1 His Kinase A (phospho-acceptor) domain-containing protein [Desulforhopalus singaporensis]